MNGPAVGIGLSLALACDLILAAESAFFGLAFVNIGLMPDGGSTLFVPAAVGKARAFQMAMLGERVEAQRALDWGLINAVHPDDRLMDEANALVERLAAGPTRSYAGTKKALNKMLYPDMPGQLDLEAELQHALARSKDFIEGVGAFIEKRDARVHRRVVRYKCAPPCARVPYLALASASSPLLVGAPERVRRPPDARVRAARRTRTTSTRSTRSRSTSGS